jgi:hypothetical protein
MVAPRSRAACSADLGGAGVDDDGVKGQMMDLTKLVKPLVWHKSHISSWNGDYHTQGTGYTVRCADEWGWKWSNSVGGNGHERSPEAAQADANADHAARVLAALDTEAVKGLVEAGSWLSVCAQTTGGTAGRDNDLVAAIEGWTAALARMKGETP